MSSVSSEVLCICYVRASWSDPWVEEPLLDCLSVADQAAPAHATAEFRREFGRGRLPAIGSRPADAGYVQIAESDFRGWYVKVVAQLPVAPFTVYWSWYGVMMERELNRYGDLSGYDEAAGEEKYTAFGLSILLDKMEPIRESVVTSGGGRVGKAFAFNDHFKATGGLYFTHAELPGAYEFWDAANAISYLLTHFAPKDQDGDVQVPFTLNSGGGLDYSLQQTAVEGHTIWDLLNGPLIAIGRGLGMNLTVNEVPAVHEVNLNVWSYSPGAVNLPSGGSITANPVQGSLVLDQALVAEKRISESLAGRYDQVRVLGDFRGSVFTLQPGHCVQGWGNATEYNEAASTFTGYSLLTDEQKAAWNAIERTEDKFFETFSRWKISTAWNGQSPAGTAVFPALDADGVVDDPAVNVNVWIGDLTIEPMLPLGAGVDYEPAVNPLQFVADEDRLPLQVWFDHELAERMDATADTIATDKREWNVQTRVEESTSWPGLNFRVAGAPQHFIADDLFVSQGSFEDVGPEMQAVDSDSWRATVYAKCQERVQAVYPADADVASGDVKRVLDYDVPHARRDYLVPGTTVGVQRDVNGDLEYVTAAGGWLNDDLPWMKDLARQLWVYVSEPRKILHLEYNSTSAIFPVGMLITSVSERITPAVTINTVITSVKVDIYKGTTTVQTQAAELDE